MGVRRPWRHFAPWLACALLLLTACEQEDVARGQPCPPPGGLVPSGCESGRAPLASDALPYVPTQSTGIVVLVAVDRTGEAQRPLAMSSARRVVYDSRILTSMAEELNALLDIRQPLFVDVRACGDANAFYDPANGRISICDEFIYEVGETFAPLPPDTFMNSVLYVVGFTFLHEVGHALFHKLDFRMAGKEEDVADQFAAFLLASSPESERIALAGAEYFAARFRANPNQLPFAWDTHSLDPQRFYNINCWILGSNPNRYADMIEKGIVPSGRVEHCAGEFRGFARTFSEWLEPYRR